MITSCSVGVNVNVSSDYASRAHLFGRGFVLGVSKIAVPQPLHLLAGAQKRLQIALGLQPSPFEEQNMVGALQDAPAMRDDQTGPSLRGKEPFPQQLFGLDVQRAGEVVEDQQLGI